MTRHSIAQQLQQMAPRPSDSARFVADTLRQIDLLPTPTNRDAVFHTSYRWRRMAIRLTTLRWTLIGSAACLVLSYSIIQKVDLILNVLSRL